MWVRLDDRFPRHPKIVGLSDRAFRAHVEAMCYCGSHETDGWIPTAAVRPGRAPVAELLDAGLWSKDGTGYRIHDWLDYNPSAADLREQRDAAADRKRRWRERRTTDDP